VVVLLSVHRLSPVRRSPFYFGPLFRALATQAPGCPIAVVLAGGGSDRAEVQAQAEAAGLGAQVHLLGSVPNHEVHWLYAAADLFIHPTYTEGFPRVLIEAMASQLPIVSTDAGGARDIVGAQQRRYVVDRRDPEAFAQATLDLLGRPVDWSALGRSNRADAARFATPAVAAMVVSTVFE
jgi:glycosyltransferase involved in cell wall biosynthesis